jgi:LacI family transcriptional regulator
MKVELTIDAIAKASGVSRATVDRIINKRSRVHPRTRDHVLKTIERLRSERSQSETLLNGRSRQAELRRIGFIIQASTPFTQSLIGEIGRCTLNKSLLGLLCAISGHVSKSDEETLRMIQQLEPDVDALAIVCKNTSANIEILHRICQSGKPVVAVSTELDAASRAGFVGMDNRRAGQIAAFIMGRNLERTPDAEVAVVIGYFAYRGHEDREIGFRTTLREYFPHVQLLEVIKGEDSPDVAYEATHELLQRRPTISGIYNVAGGNQGVAKAIMEAKLTRRPIHITHEVNADTEPLIKRYQIDYLLTQDLDQMILNIGEILLEVKTAGGITNLMKLLPIRILTPFNFP